MAFSYSDKNFTVIGNLCFVHIPLDGTKYFDIPPAICDRMLFDKIVCSYVYTVKNETSGASALMPNIRFASIAYGKIFCSDVGEGYLSFYFPIDSNK